MKKAMVILLGSLLVSGCGPSIDYKAVDVDRDDESETNRRNLEKLQVGMSEEEVMAIMGDKTSGVATLESESLEILYYYTGKSCDDHAITSADEFVAEVKHQLTPLVFKNRKLIGWGWDFLDSGVEQDGPR